jgi:DNA-binding CsgD family transcriptional regulator
MARGTLNLADVRALLQLVRELRELGEPAEWRKHLAQSLERLCGARAVLVGELSLGSLAGRGRSPALAQRGVRVLHRELRGVPSEAQARFDEEVVWGVHGFVAASSTRRSRAVGRFTLARHQLVDDRRWYRSELANDRLRAHDCGDFIMQMLPIAEFGAVAGIKMFRSVGDRPFAERDRLLLELIGEELAHDWNGYALPSADDRVLSPREKRVLALFAAGASEKEAAAALGISTHTVHGYAKSLYRSLTVHSRAELLARFGKPQAARTRLTCESEGFGSVASEALLLERCLPPR